MSHRGPKLDISVVRCRPHASLPRMPGPACLEKETLERRRIRGRQSCCHSGQRTDDRHQNSNTSPLARGVCQLVTVVLSLLQNESEPPESRDSAEAVLIQALVGLTVRPLPAARMRTPAGRGSPCGTSQAYKPPQKIVMKKCLWDVRKTHVG